MKKTYFLLLQLVVTLQLIAQNDSCLMEFDRVLNLNYQFLPDTSFDPYRFSFMDDTSRYIKSSGDSTSDNDWRLVYFVHGLGGSDKAWSASSFYFNNNRGNAVTPYVTHTRRYWDEVVDYNNTPSSQLNFDKLASDLTTELIDHENMYNLHMNSDPTKTASTALPYAIGHSQGGLALRDLDWRYDNFPGTIGPRRFHGIVTFGTPHNGARIGVAQDEVKDFANEFCVKLGRPKILEFGTQILLKVPVKISGLSASNLKQLADSTCAFLTNDLLDALTKSKQAPITAQYGPSSIRQRPWYNYSNPDIPKVAVVGIEEEPVLYRQLKYLVGDEAYEYAPFAINPTDDDEWVETIDDLTNQMFSRYKYWAWKKRVLQKKYNRPITRKQTRQEYKNARATRDAFWDAYRFLPKTNDLYKTIIGAYDINNPIKTVHTGNTLCKVKYRYIRDAPNGDYSWKFQYKVFETYRDYNCRCGFPTFGLVELINDNRVVCEYEKELIMEQVSTDKPSDGTVLAESQAAFSGATSRIIMENTNHIEMRNNWQTKIALEKIFDTKDDVDIFFYINR